MSGYPPDPSALGGEGELHLGGDVPPVVLEGDVGGSSSDGSAPPANDLLELQRRPLRRLKPHDGVGVRGAALVVGGRLVGVDVAELAPDFRGEGVGGADSSDSGLDEGPGVGD